MLDMDLAISVYIDENKAMYDRKMAMHADAFEGKIGPLLAAVTAPALGLQDVASAMSAAAEETTCQAATVTAAAEQTSVNVQTVATATEELHSSVSEISRQVAHSATIARGAVEAAQRTNATVQGLSTAAHQIGDIVKLIRGIASQTNLLAPNTTIEAVCYGEAGKGFAVVASEVKGLATATAKVTETIASQIAAIHAATSEAVLAVQGISDTITTISEIATTIASTVEEQSVATQEIARNVADVATGTDAVSNNISGVKHAANDAGTAANPVLNAANELGGRAETLRADVDAFLSEIREA
jgi:methyl-accepting chemotaxis protein